MNYSKTLISCAILIFLSSCNNDDAQTDTEQSQTINYLTNGDSKVWKISQAVLTNSQGVIDISQNFNVLDDEFIFTKDGEAHHKIGKEIKLDAQNLKDSKLDQNRSTVTGQFSFSNDNSGQVIALGGDFVFEILSENQINGVLAYPEFEATISIELTPKTAQYYLQPIGGLNFSDLYTFDFELQGTGYTTPGMIGSYRENSLYIVLPMDPGLTGYNGMLKFDLTTNNYIEYIDTDGAYDLVTKQLHFVDEELVVVGGQSISHYDLDLTRQEAPVDHDLEISRFGTSAIDDNVYIVGGSFNEDVSGIIEAEKIYKWNTTNQSLDFIGELPEDRIGARCAMDDGKLYVFGGMSSFFPIIPDPKDTIYIYDIATGSVSSEQMSDAMEVSYVSKEQNLIYVAGYSTVIDSNGDFSDYDLSFGTYNLFNNSYQGLDHNLTVGQGEFINVVSMTVHDNKMYILTLTYPNSNTNDIISLDLKVANLN